MVRHEDHPPPSIFFIAPPFAYAIFPLERTAKDGVIFLNGIIWGTPLDLGAIAIGPDLCAAFPEIVSWLPRLMERALSAFARRE
jgi:hypothetical protein